MTEQFKINRVVEPAKEKHLLADSRATHGVQSIFTLLQDLLEMVGNFPFGVCCCHSNRLSCGRCEQGINPLFAEESIELFTVIAVQLFHHVSAIKIRHIIQCS